ncbi:MAG: hypothetical protein H0W90_15240 [Actinobacteria bacterium]|nr:hypothetical protein [Actinomycetota bacterium]
MNLRHGDRLGSTGIPYANETPARTRVRPLRDGKTWQRFRAKGRWILKFRPSSVACGNLAGHRMGALKKFGIDPNCEIFERAYAYVAEHY